MLSLDGIMSEDWLMAHTSTTAHTSDPLCMAAASALGWALVRRAGAALEPSQPYPEVFGRQAEAPRTREFFAATLSKATLSRMALAIPDALLMW